MVKSGSANKGKPEIERTRIAAAEAVFINRLLNENQDFAHALRLQKLRSTLRRIILSSTGALAFDSRLDPKAFGAGSKSMKIVLAYSGGLDTSVLLSWIKDKYNAEMIAFCANIGQEEELKGLDKKAMKTGASKLYIDDLQEEFARDFIFPMMQAGAIYENQYFLGTSIARPLIAKRMVEIARAEGAHPRRDYGKRK